MKRIVLGTAGHIDHGKTMLTKALTGVDTDRLAEEKARGITIELGFAPMRLSDGTEISLIDVPGHEKFVRTMMAGVSGIDGVLLVIAADDGVMPQTREHFDILRLLNIRRGIIVLTKVDLVDEERIAEVRRQVYLLTQGSFLENAPICTVSAATGYGISALREEIENLVRNAGERNCERPFRLPVDRAFPVAGFGTVATGTLTEGTVHAGDAVEIMPSATRGSVRTLQTHGESVPLALAGMRTAMSFSGVEKDALQRGSVVVEPDSVIVTDLITAKIQILADCPYRIRNSSQLHLFHGTDEQVCKLRLLDSECLQAGESGFAQFKLAQPISVRWDDRFLLRFFSPVITIGGGTILTCGGTRLRRNHPPVLERLDRLSDERISARLAQRIEDCALIPISGNLLRMHSNLSMTEYKPVETEILNAGLAFEPVPGRLIGREAVGRRLSQAVSLLENFHETYPLQAGMRIAEWRSRLFPETDVPVDALLDYWIGTGQIKSRDGFVALPGFSPVFTQEHKIMQRKLLHFFREAWFFAPDIQAVNAKFQRFGKLYDQVLANMRISEMLIPLTPRYWVHYEAFREALEIFTDLAKNGKPVTLAEFRTAANISRKYSQMFLEYWDRRGITRRVGDAHILLRKKT